jgi:hypothetical protein
MLVSTERNVFCVYALGGITSGNPHTNLVACICAGTMCVAAQYSPSLLYPCSVLTVTKYVCMTEIHVLLGRGSLDLT